MNNIKKLVLVVAGLALLGCSSTKTETVYIPKPTAPYIDHHFAVEQQRAIETTEEIFHVTPAMKLYVKNRLMNFKSVGDRTKRLLYDFFDPKQLNIVYDSNANYTAEETFNLGTANCLSLTILAHTLLAETSLDTKFIDVKVQENWTVTEGLSLLNGHVNLEVSQKQQVNFVRFVDKSYTIDFLPMLTAPVIKKTEIEKDEIVGLFYGNKGAEAIANKNMDLAYKYFRAATEKAPNMAALWGNLASLYRMTGHYEQAEKIYKHALVLDPDNLNIKQNFAILYQVTGKQELAQALRNEVNSIRNENPYYHAMLAEEALLRGNLGVSESKFKKAISIKKQEHQFYFGLAKTYLKMGKLNKANDFLKKAKRYSEQKEDKDKYQNKMSAIQQLTSVQSK